MRKKLKKVFSRLFRLYVEETLCCCFVFVYRSSGIYCGRSLDLIYAQVIYIMSSSSSPLKDSHLGP